MTVLRLLLGLLLLSLASCATMTIMSPDPSVDIYVNGTFQGKGKVEVQKMGPPATLDIEAKSHDRVILDTSVSRSFKTETFCFGLITYGVGFYFAWLYPDDVFLPKGIDTTKVRVLDAWQGGVQDTGSVWGRPMGSPSKPGAHNASSSPWDNP